MSNNQKISQPVSKAESAESKREVPKIFFLALAVGAIAICAVLAIGAKFIFH